MILLLISALIHSVSAFELAPEYTFLSENETVDFDDPKWVDGEYVSDFFTFKRPLTDSHQRWTLRNHYDLAIGSLSGKEFLTNQRIFLSQKMHDDVEFRLTGFEDRDYEQDHRQLVIELIYWWHDWGLALNGSPSFNKSEDDIGGALIRRGFLGGEARLFVNFPDFQLNKRNRGTDRWFGSQSPLAAGFLSRSPHHEAAFRFERPTVWYRPDEGRLYNFKRMIMQAKKWWDGERGTFAVAAFYENKFEGQAPLTGSTAARRFLTRRRGLFQSEWNQPIGPHDLKAGLALSFRDYSSDREDFKTYNILPYAWWTLPWRGTDAFRRRWRFGIDASVFDTGDPATFLTEPVDTFSIDGRFNIAMDMAASDRWSLNFLATFDTDLNHSDTIWEGGAAQFRIYF